MAGARSRRAQVSLSAAYPGRTTRTAVPPLAPAPTVIRPFKVRARSSIASKLRRRRSPVPSSEISVAISPSTCSTRIEIRVGGPRRIAWLTASRMIWYSPTCAFSARVSAASRSRSICTWFERPTWSAKARTAGAKPWSRRTTGSTLNESSRNERIVSRCLSSAEASTRRASSRRLVSIEPIAASSISPIPDIDCTGPSWRKSASRRRSSCSAVTIWSERRARSASRTFASARSRAFSAARAAKSASTVARTTSPRSNGRLRVSLSEAISSPWTRSGKSTERSFGALAGWSPGGSIWALARKIRSASRRVCSRISPAACVCAIVPIDSTSDSRKLACATSSPSFTSCRRRSAIRSSENATIPAPPTAPARPAQASNVSPVARPTIARTAKATTAPTAIAGLIDDRVAKRNRNRVRPRVRLELGEDVPDVALDRLLADEQPRRDVGVRHPVGEKLQDLPLPAGEHLVAGVAEEGGHQRGVDETVARDDLVDRLQQGLVRRLLEDVALGPGLEPAAEQAALAVGREDQHRRLGNLLGQDLGRFEPVHPGHADVHDHD